MKLKAAGTFLLIFLCTVAGPATAEYVQLPGVVHVHSTVSSGLYSTEELVHMAKDMGLEVLVLTDHDLVAMEYGIFPFRNLIKKRVERNSVTRLGPEKYLSMISQVNQRQKDVVVIPGVQSSPFYYWTGSPLSENLTAHNYRKELLLIGMMSADDYRDLLLACNRLLHRRRWPSRARVLRVDKDSRLDRRQGDPAHTARRSRVRCPEPLRHLCGNGDPWPATGFPGHA